MYIGEVQLVKNKIHFASDQQFDSIAYLIMIMKRELDMVYLGVV
jgi:hypothetical protein